MIDYEIIKADPALGQIEVLYTNGEQRLGVYAIDVPVIDGAFLTGDALDQEIRHRAPTWAVEREAQVKTATGFSEIEALVVAQPEADEATQEELANAEMWAQTEFDQRVAKSLVRLGILESDPTSIPVSRI